MSITFGSVCNEPAIYGEGLGLWNATTNLPAIIAPLLGSLIINIADRFGQIELGYRLVFMVASLFLIVAAVSILFVREGKAAAQQQKSPLSQEEGA